MTQDAPTHKPSRRDVLLTAAALGAATPARVEEGWAVQKRHAEVLG